MFKDKDSLVFKSNNVGQIVKDYRQFLGLNRKGFAEMFKLGVNVLRNIEDNTNALRYNEATQLLFEILHCEYEPEDGTVTLDTRFAELWRAVYLFKDFHKRKCMHSIFPNKRRSMDDFVNHFTSPLPIQDQVDIFSVLYRWINGTSLYAFNAEEDTVEEAGKKLWEEAQQKIGTLRVKDAAQQVS